MTLEFTRVQRITNALMLHATSLPDIGLLHGKMGVAIYFHCLARQSKIGVLGTFADELIDQVVEDLHTELPVGFERGITGIGWAVEYLIQNGFVEADADEVLEEVDAKVRTTLIHSKNSFDTLLAIGYYYVARLGYRIGEKERLAVLDLKYHTILLIDELERHFDGYETSLEAAHLLDELHKLNIFNYKVDKLKSRMQTKAYDFRLPFVARLNSEQVDELLSATDVKSRYAGYDMSALPETERWGLLNGIAGFGLQKIMNDNELQ